MKSKNTVVNKFFDLCVKNCDNKYMPLFEHTTSPNKNYQDDLYFYAVLRGEKNDVKHGILNSLLICWWEFNLQTRGSRKGMIYESTSTSTHLKQLFSHFHKKHIKYNFGEDFTGPAEFGSVVGTA